MGEDVHVAQLRQMQDVPHIPHLNTSIPGPDYVLPEVTEEEEQALEEDPVLHAHDEDELAWLRRLPWWHKPRPLWLLPVLFLFALSAGMMLASRLELILALICKAMHVDDIELHESSSLSLASLPSFIHPVHAPSAVCRRSVQAQSRLSIIQLELVVIVGVFSMLTTSFWSQLSDRKGRTRVLAIALSGSLCNDAVSLCVSLVSLSNIPLGWWILVWGSVIEGILGASGTVTAMAQSYLTDITSSGTRSRLYALMTGVLFAGVAIGPTIGGFVTKYTGSLSLTILLASLVRLSIFAISPMIPESLNPAVRENATQEHDSMLRFERDRHGQMVAFWAGVKKAIMTPLESLSFLLPRRKSSYALVPNESFPTLSSTEQRVTSSEWDTNLLLLSAAYAVEMTCIAIVPVKIQYVQLVFGWSSSAVGLFVSFAAVSRMLTLTVLVPLLVKLLHRMPKSIVLPQDAAFVSASDAHEVLDEHGRLLYASPPASWTQAEQQLEKRWMARAKQLQLIHDSHMDMYIAVVSAFITVVASIIMAHSRTSGLFMFGTFAVSLGAGIGSAVSSLGMAVIPRADGAGRLFGAWAILSTLSSAIVGPFMFSMVFSRSASTTPSLVFYLVGALQLLTLSLLYFVRLSSSDTLEGLAPRPHAPFRRNRL